MYSPNHHQPVPRQRPADLLWRNPACMMCGDEVSHAGDGWSCENCHAYWPTDNPEHGEWTNDVADQCTATTQPFADNPHAIGKPYQYETVRCLLDATHTGTHKAGVLRRWDDHPAQDPWAAR
ncbi:hypothetical protein ACWGID_29270 [Kribbella sp. NPDC054772]